MRSNTTLEVSRNTSIIGIRCFTKINIYIRSRSNSSFSIHSNLWHCRSRSISSRRNSSGAKYSWNSNILTSIKCGSNTNTNYITTNINLSWSFQFSSSICITSNGTHKIISVNIIPFICYRTQIICVRCRRSYITGNLKFWCWICGSYTEITINCRHRWT